MEVQLDENSGAPIWRRSFILTKSGAAPAKVFNSEDHFQYHVVNELRGLRQTHEGCYVFITLTIRPSEIMLCDKRNVVHSEYLVGKLIDFPFKGVFVLEYTKKGEPHLHGIVAVRNPISKEELQSLKEDWFAQVNIRAINQEESFRKYTEYMTKTFINPNVLKWISM